MRKKIIASLLLFSLIISGCNVKGIDKYHYQKGEQYAQMIHDHVFRDSTTFSENEADMLEYFLKSDLQDDKTKKYIDDVGSLYVAANILSQEKEDRKKLLKVYKKQEKYLQDEYGIRFK